TRVHADRAARGDHRAGTPGGPRGTAPVRARRPVQAGGGARPDRADRRRPRPVPARRRLLSDHTPGPRRAPAKPGCDQLERPISEEERAEGPVGQPLQVPLLPGPARRLRPLVRGLRRPARRRRRERRHHIMGPERAAVAARGFTLLELLVTLVVIVIAVAVVVPTIGKSADTVRVRAEVAVVAAIQGFAEGLRLLRLAGEHQQAILLADQKIREVVTPTEERTSDVEGPFTWERTITIVPTPDLSRTPATEKWHLYQITMRV